MSDDVLYLPRAIEVLRANWPEGAELALFLNKVWQDEKSAPKSDVENSNE